MREIQRALLSHSRLIPDFNLHFWVVPVLPAILVHIVMVGVLSSRFGFA
jgi:hypothetical protein